MIVLLIVLLLIIIDLLACLLFCTRNKKKSDFYGMFVNAPSQSGIAAEWGDKDSHETGVPHAKNETKDKFKRCILSWLGSLLRLNLFWISYFPSHHVRNFLYRHVFKVTLDKTAVVYYGAEIRAPWNLYIGKGSIIGDKALLDARNGIYIGENVNFSTGVWIYTLQHNVQASDFSTEGEGRPVIIKNRAWVSTRAVVLPGAVIEEGSVIAAGAVVTKSTEQYTINGGIPCKKIGERNKNLEYEFEGKHQHFL